MSAPVPGPIAIVGGTGYLGQRIAAALREAGRAVRIVSRHATGPDAVRADLTDPASLGAACAGAAGVVNAAGLYRERRGATYQAIHVEGAGALARAARAAGAARLVHLSGIGADPAARDPYIRARGEGERAVREAFPDVTILRPSALFDAEHAFFGPLRGILIAPVVPLFGDGSVRLQPVYAGDVARAAARAATGPAPPLLELGGPTVYTYREILEKLARKTGRRPWFLPLPLGLWHGIAAILQPLPGAPITPAMVALLARDNVADPALPGLVALGVAPTSAESLGIL